MAARVETTRVYAGRGMRESIARSRSVGRNAAMVADVLVPTDVPVSMATLGDIVRLTTGLDLATGA